MRRDPIAPIFFQKNRERLAASVPAHSLILIRGNTLVKRSDGLFYPFHQDTDFYYFTGVNLEDCALLILTDETCSIKEEYFFHPTSDSLELVWTGRLSSLQQILKSSAFRSYKSHDQFGKIVNDIQSQAKVFVTDEKQDHHLAASLNLNISNPSSSLKQYSKTLRTIKQPVELALLKRASQITANGFERLVKQIQAGVFEYELEGTLAKCFIAHQADGFAYPPIIASGVSGILLHYQENNQMLRSGDLVLVDIGASYSNYKADITRVFPVSGRFTSRQAQVYQVVLDILRFLIDSIEPGMSWDKLEAVCAEKISRGLVDLGLLSDSDLQHIPQAYKPFMPHRVGHLIGLDVHESTEETSLRPGMVLAIEPALYIPKEGIAIRLEENILITEQGCKVLSEGIPLEIQEIEALMSNK